MKPAVKFKWWYCIIAGLAGIIDGLVMMLTLGWFSTNLSLRACLYGIEKDIYRTENKQ